jgi:hypothetical protein
VRREPSSRAIALMRAVIVGLLSGTIVGIPLGVLNRVYQRITAIVAEQHLEFTPEGSLGIVLVTVIPFAIPAGIAYVAIGRFLPSHQPAHSLTFGLLLLVVLGLPYLWAAPMGINTTGNVWLNRAMYGSLPVLAGVALPVISGIVDRHVPTPTHRVGQMGYGALTLVGVACCAAALLATIGAFVIAVRGG